MKKTILPYAIMACLLSACQPQVFVPFPPAELNIQSQSGWKELPSMPEPRYNLQANLMGQAIYLSGGFNDQRILDSFERFELETQRWTVLPPMPRPRYIHAAVSLEDHLYIMGGYQIGSRISELLAGQSQPRGALAEVDRYHTPSGQWEAMAPMNTPRFMPAAVAHQGKIYVAGGGGPDRKLLASMEVYDPKSNRWSTLVTMPEPRVWGQLVSDGRYLYWIGGTNERKEFLSTIDRWDPQTGQWQTNALPALPKGRAGFAAQMTPEGLYIAGGTHPGGFLNQVDFYRFETGKWEALPAISPGRAGLDMVYSAQQLYLFGTDAWYTNNSLKLMLP